jgi:periplasmic protein CpxP/Spy
MNRRLTRMEWMLAAGSLVVTLAGAGYMSVADLNAQGRGGPGRGAPGIGRMGVGPGGPGRRGGPGGAGLVGLMLGRVDLTDAQKDQVKQIVESHKAEQDQLFERGRAAHQALDAAITADSFDINNVRAKANDVATVETEVTVLRSLIRNEVFQILTAEQKAEIKKDQERREARRAEMEKRRTERSDGRR